MRYRLLWAAIAIAFSVFGCLSCKPKEENAVAYHPVPADQERAYWRNRYNQVRPEAPKGYSVPPKPPRDNLYGEFKNDMYPGIDRQPELPPLPGDVMTLPPPRDVFSGSVSGGRNYDDAPMASPAPGTAGAGRIGEPMRLTGPGIGGVKAGSRFYPVEQLIYGGDYPELEPSDQYRLMPRDIVTLTVKDHPEFSGQLEIQSDGTIKIPNAFDIVPIRGLTAEEAAEKARQAIAVYVKGECRVMVQANRARGGYYFVFGEVQQPGRFPMGLEPVRLSEAVLAANWEANPARRDLDGDELGPAFPAASPRGKYIAPRNADLARVMLITPHRSRPVRTVHDVRSAFLGETGGDTIVRSGQIIIIPSLSGVRNAAWELDVPEALGRSSAPAGVPASDVDAGGAPRGFAGSSSGVALPDTVQPSSRRKVVPPPKPDPETENMVINRALGQERPSPGRGRPGMTSEYYSVGPPDDDAWMRTPSPSPTQEMLENRERPPNEKGYQVGSVYRYSGITRRPEGRY